MTNSTTGRWRKRGLGSSRGYFGLREALEGLLGFPVDLVTTAAVQNPFFRESLQRSRQALYAA